MTFRHSSVFTLDSADLTSLCLNTQSMSWYLLKIFRTRSVACKEKHGNFLKTCLAYTVNNYITIKMSLKSSKSILIGHDRYSMVCCLILFPLKWKNPVLSKCTIFMKYMAIMLYVLCQQFYSSRNMVT